MDRFHGSSTQPIAGETCNTDDEGQTGPGPYAEGVQNVIERTHDGRDLYAVFITPDLDFRS